MLSSTRKILFHLPTENKSNNTKQEKYRQSCDHLRYQMRLLCSSFMLRDIQDITEEDEKERKNLSENNPIDTMEEPLKQSIANIIQKSYSLMECMNNRIEILSESQKENALAYFSQIIGCLIESVKNPFDNNKREELSSLLNDPNKSYLRTNSDDKIKAIGLFMLSAFLLICAICVILFSIKASIPVIIIADLLSCGTAYESCVSFAHGVKSLSRYRKSSLDLSIVKDLENESAQPAIKQAISRSFP